MSVPSYASVVNDPTGSSPKTFAITPSDTADLSNRIRCIVIGTTAGVIVYHNWDGEVCTTGSHPVGGPYPIMARRILSTGTTAAGLTGYV